MQAMVPLECRVRALVYLSPFDWVGLAMRMTWGESVEGTATHRDRVRTVATVMAPTTLLMA